MNELLVLLLQLSLATLRMKHISATCILILSGMIHTSWSLVRTGTESFAFYLSFFVTIKDWSSNIITVEGSLIWWSIICFIQHDQTDSSHIHLLSFELPLRHPPLCVCTVRFCLWTLQTEVQLATGTNWTLCQQCGQSSCFGHTGTQISLRSDPSILTECLIENNHELFPDSQSILNWTVKLPW